MSRTLAHPLVLPLLMVSLLSSCISGYTGIEPYNYQPPYAGIFYSKVRYSNERRSRPLIGSGEVLKKGESCTFSIGFVSYYYFESGGSLEAAARSAGIQKVAAVDYFLFTVFGGIYIRQCLTVWGQ